MIRYDTSGRRDLSFGNAGIVSLSQRVYALKILANQKILAVGSIDNNIKLSLFTAEGQPDTTFGMNGSVFTDLTSESTFNSSRSVQIQRDGKIIVAGYAFSASTTNYDFLILRYTPQGSLDTSFGSGGKIIVNLSATEATLDMAYGIGLQWDSATSTEKIILAGWTRSSDASDIGLIRYTSQGVLDLTFGTNGVVVTNIGRSTATQDYAYSLLILPDNKFLVVGHSQDDFVTLRFSSDGVLDSSFGTGGVVQTDIGVATFDMASALILQVDGKIVVVGAANNDAALVRYMGDGELDTSFGSAGKVVTDIGGGTMDAGYAMIVQPDDKIIVTGRSLNQPGWLSFLARYHSNGSLDTSFGSGGLMMSRDSVQYYALALSSEGILAAGPTHPFYLGHFNVMKYDIDGHSSWVSSLQASFGTSSSDYNYALKVQNDEKILLAGITDQDFALARYNASRDADLSFGNNGLVVTNVGGASRPTSDAAYAMDLQEDPGNDDKIVVGGKSDNDLALIRYKSDGSIDGNFGPTRTGVVVTDLGGVEESIKALEVQSDRKILAVGKSDGDFFVMRYLEDGRLDTNFGSNGFAVINIGGAVLTDDIAEALAVQRVA